MVSAGRHFPRTSVNLVFSTCLLKFYHLIGQGIQADKCEYHDLGFFHKLELIDKCDKIREHSEIFNDHNRPNGRDCAHDTIENS
jgi:hypothetical protein